MSNRIRILVVDDEPHVLSVMKKLDSLLMAMKLKQSMLGERR